jgi:hypothetical protein
MILRKLTVICFITILAISTLPFAGLASDNPKVILNGKTLTFDIPPEIDNGRTFVPLRTIFEALGAQINWDDNTKTVTATKDSLVIVLKIGESNAHVNNEIVSLDAPAKIVSGRTLVPLRFVSEAMGSTVDWDGITKTVTISSSTESSSKPTTPQQIMTPEEAVELFKTRLEEVGVSIVDSGFGIRLEYNNSDFEDIVLDGVTYYCISFIESYGSWGGIGFYAVNSITGDIHQILPNWDESGNIHYEFIEDLTDDEIFKKRFGTNVDM